MQSSTTAFNTTYLDYNYTTDANSTAEYITEDDDNSTDAMVTEGGQGEGISTLLVTGVTEEGQTTAVDQTTTTKVSRHLSFEVGLEIEPFTWCVF